MSLKISRRKLLQRGSALAATGLLAACAPQSAPAPTSAPAQGVPAATYPPAPTSEKKVKVEFMNWWGGNREPLMDNVIAAFQAENPDIEVVNQAQPAENREERQATALASSTPPGLMMSQRVQTYKFAEEGLIIPIDDYVAAAGLDVDNLFYPADIDNQRWGGKLWALPLPNGGGMDCFYFYNKKLLKAAGFDPEAPPRTWQELEQVAKATTTTKSDAIDVMGCNGVASNDPTVFIVWLLCNNGNLATDDARTLLINTPEAVETLEWMVRYANELYGGIEKVADFWQNARDSSPDFPFYRDQVAILFHNVSFFGFLKENASDTYNDPSQWGVALRPYNGNNAKASHHGESGLSFAWGYVIPKAAPKDVQEAAYKFSQFLCTHEKGTCYFMLEQARPSPFKKCNENPEYKKANPYWDTVLKALETDVAVPITPVQTEINALIKEALDKVFFGQATAKAALDEATKAGQAILDRFWGE